MFANRLLPRDPVWFFPSAGSEQTFDTPSCLNTVRRHMIAYKTPVRSRHLPHAGDTSFRSISSSSPTTCSINSPALQHSTRPLRLEEQRLRTAPATTISPIAAIPCRASGAASRSHRCDWSRMKMLRTRSRQTLHYLSQLSVPRRMFCRSWSELRVSDAMSCY